MLNRFLKRKPKNRPAGAFRPEFPKSTDELIDNRYKDSELIIALVGAAGTDPNSVTTIIKDQMTAFGYHCENIRISKDILEEVGDIGKPKNDHDRILKSMEAGNRLREQSGDNSFLALSAAAKINEIRTGDKDLAENLEPLKKTCFIIQSLKHPEEVQRLRNIYSPAFFLLGVHSEDKRRREHLINKLRMDERQAQEIMDKDYNEKEEHGQHTSDTFHLSDFFISDDGNKDKLEKSIWRILDLIFGSPFITPTFDEYAMFMAFSASLRSADLSRQVGAVIARRKSILSTGANDVPSPDGGLYWSYFDAESKQVMDVANGRDYKRGFDSNSQEKAKIIEGIVAKLRSIDGLAPESIEPIIDILKTSGIKDITEYGRVVHAEMDALLSCARNNISTKDATLYCTTFPCHNCAKHIITSGVKRVVFVQPYSKSRTLDFHSDSVSFSDGENPRGEKLVKFEPFIGVGPRNFLNLFSMNLGIGYPLARKKADGSKIDWQRADSRIRMQLLPCSYIERETYASNRTSELLEIIYERKS